MGKRDYRNGKTWSKRGLEVRRIHTLIKCPRGVCEREKEGERDVELSMNPLWWVVYIIERLPSSMTTIKRWIGG